MSEACQHVPHLLTSNATPLARLEQIFLMNQTSIEAWFREEFAKTPAPITSSVDVRNAGYKIAPVDTNLFPAGFNNLNQDFLPLCIQAAQSIICQAQLGCKKIILVPESHTRNTFYMQSLATLFQILSKAGFEVRIGSLIDGLSEAKPYVTELGDELLLEPLERKGNRLCIGDFDPCLVILNNDLSEGIPDILSDIEQLVRPSSLLGWANRLKSGHFNYYQQLTEQFCRKLELDPWLLTPLFDVSDGVDFKEQTGVEHLAHKVDNLIEAISEKYRHYDINQTPFVVVKADSGTYGMSVMMVKSGEELLTLNRKQRKKMAASKGAKTVNQVIIQEGVYSQETWGADNGVAEPVVYMIGHYVVGGFYRVHLDKKSDENLNAPGMHFERLAFDGACNMPNKQLPAENCINRFYAYGVIARLAGLAAAHEIAAVEQ